jgi:hypothetical protein
MMLVAADVPNLLLLESKSLCPTLALALSANLNKTELSLGDKIKQNFSLN